MVGNLFVVVVVFFFSSSSSSSFCSSSSFSPTPFLPCSSHLRFSVQYAGYIYEYIALFVVGRRLAVENELSWNTAPLMAETTNVRSALFLTMPTVVEYCGIIHCGAFASLSIPYGAQDFILFISLCSYENNSSPPHWIPGNHIPVCNIDKKKNFYKKLPWTFYIGQ